MNKSIIKVQNLSKRYRLGLNENRADTITGQLANIIKSPWQNLKRLREMSRFGIEDESVFWALKDINFEVKEGEVLGIIGKNGAGKSTLLKILSGITDPSEGKVEICGRVASLLEVGTGFHPELSGRENIYMNGTILGMTKREIDSKLDEIIDFSGVEKFIDTPVKFYSSGMKVRLGFSVAAHLDPEILIIDEVLAVGDYEFQKKCLGKMEDVSKNQGRTVLFVSHNMSAVKNLCPTSILLENGKKLYHSNTDFVLDSYFNFSQPENRIVSIFNKNNIAIGFFDHLIRESTTFCAGDTMVVDFFIPFSLFDFDISIGINSFEGVRLFTCNSYYSKTSLFNIYNSGNIVCTIPNVNLVPGKYYIEIAFYDSERRVIGYSANVECINIIENNFFKINKIIDEGLKGYFLQENLWETK